MRFVILGGDQRSLWLLRLLREAGHTVSPLALERGLDEAPAEPTAALGAAEALVLPIPAERGGRLNAPLSEGSWDLYALLALLRPGTPVFCGAPPASLRPRCADLGLPIHDLLVLDSFARRNAALSAEGAVALLSEGPDAVCGSRVLVTGGGRLAMALVARLRALEASVTLAARDPAQRAAGEALGCRAVEFSAAAEPGYDHVVNTVPSRLFGEGELRAFGPCRLLELASPPYGIDPAASQSIGNPVRLAPGLPGRYAPRAAAKAIRDAIFEILEASPSWNPCESGWR